MKERIDHINKAIIDAVYNEGKKPLDLQPYSLADSVAILGNEDVTFPAIVLRNGECISVYNETDKHDITLYHRLNRVSYSEVEQGFGNARAYNEVDELSIIVFGKREKIDKFRLGQLICKAIASDPANTLVESDFNSLQVFASEYLGVTYFMTPAYFLFKINYRITSTYNPRCAN